MKKIFLLMKHIYTLLEYYICHFNSVNNVEREIHGNKFSQTINSHFLSVGG